MVNPDWEDLAERLDDLKTPVFINLIWDETLERLEMDTNAEDQGELVSILLWLVSRFASGELEYPPGD